MWDSDPKDTNIVEKLEAIDDGSVAVDSQIRTEWNCVSVGDDPVNPCLDSVRISGVSSSWHIRMSPQRLEM